MNSIIHRIGFWSGMAAFTMATAFIVVQLLQLVGALLYPWDEILIYGTSFAIVVPFLFEMLALHYVTAPEKRIWTHAALIFSNMYAVFVSANYIVQLATVIPTTLKGSGEEIRVLAQTPHSLFWNFDALGYIFMGLATLAAVPALRQNRRARRVRYAFLANALATPLIAIVYFYPDFSARILLLGSVWGITAPASMLLLALMFRQSGSIPPKKIFT